MAKRTIREEWRPVPGHPGYEVSDQGRVRSTDRWRWRRHARGGFHWRFLPGKILRTSVGWGGYHMVHLGNPLRTVYTHQLVLRVFKGPPPKGLEACHENEIKADNRLSNLKYDTHSNNILNSAEHGASNRGSRHYRSKLTEADVRSIRRSPLRVCDLAEKYGVNEASIRDVLSRQTWGWLE